MDAAERYDYPLTPDSVVLDVGGYHGLWTSFLIQYHGFSPRVYIFEPMPECYADIRDKFASNPKVQALNVGLSDGNRTATFANTGDSTGAWSRSESSRTVSIRDISEVLKELGVESIDLISINCEGGEYSILTRMIATGMVHNCRYIQVQYHNLFPEASEMRDRIREALSLTHREKYNSPWQWEAWER